MLLFYKIACLIKIEFIFKDALIVYKLAVYDCIVPESKQMYFLEYSFFSEAIYLYSIFTYISNIPFLIWIKAAKFRG